ncbi:MAG: hypothetical protein M1335_04055 [Chloroflexi bacterium]|nr:hypothetical protein [Chloroflexota bacterium]
MNAMLKRLSSPDTWTQAAITRLVFALLIILLSPPTLLAWSYLLRAFNSEQGALYFGVVILLVVLLIAAGYRLSGWIGRRYMRRSLGEQLRENPALLYDLRATLSACKTRLGGLPAPQSVSIDGLSRLAVQKQRVLVHLRTVEAVRIGYLTIRGNMVTMNEPFCSALKERPVTDLAEEIKGQAQGTFKIPSLPLKRRPAYSDRDRPSRIATGIQGLDALLSGGFVNPREEAGLCITISGRPGAGKTLMALSIAINQVKEKRNVLYCALEQDAMTLRHVAEQCGWIAEGDHTRWADGATYDDAATTERGCLYTHHLPPGEQASPEFRDRLDTLMEHLATRPYSLVVIDSLEVFGANVSLDRDKIMELRRAIHNAGAVALFVSERADGDKDGPEDFVSDALIELSGEFISGYWIRWLQITKCRFQEHGLGKHQFKINAGYGITVYPSLHFLLSDQGRAFVEQSLVREGGQKLPPGAAPDGGTTAAVPVVPPPSTGFARLDESLGGGLPVGSITALVGEAGTKKRALALCFLAQGSLRGVAGLMISLREHKQIIKETPLCWDDSKPDPTPDDIDRCWANIYHLDQRPGYITPEEFVYKVLTELRKSGARLVVFEDVAQLRPRFRLLAESDIFLATLIDIFRKNGVTAMFIAVAGQGANEMLNYDLMAMADNIATVTHTGPLQEAAIKLEFTKIAKRYTDKKALVLKFTQGPGQPNGRPVVRVQASDPEEVVEEVGLN